MREDHVDQFEYIFPRQIPLNQLHRTAEVTPASRAFKFLAARSDTVGDVLREPLKSRKEAE
jgi:hypothetical protein